MDGVVRRVTFDEFSSNLGELFDRVVHDSETLEVERATGEIVVLKPALRLGSHRRKKTKADHEAFLSSLGGWDGLVDTDKLVHDIYESRNIASRPHIEL